MALKNLTSNFDLVNNGPVNEMETTAGVQFDLGTNSILQQDSLVNEYSYNHGNTSDNVGPSLLDLNGGMGPQFQLSINDTSQRHVDSLLEQYQYSYGQGVNPFSNSTAQAGPTILDLDGQQGPQFDNGIEPGGFFNQIDTLHEQSLTSDYSYQHGDSFANINATTLDLNGLQGPNFDLGTNSTFHNTDSLLNFYLYNYGGYQEVVTPSELDLNTEQGPNFDLGPESTLHGDSLLEQYQYTHGQGVNTFGNSQGQTGPSDLDLNGANGTAFDNGINSTIHNPDSLLEMYEYSYGQGVNPFGNSQGQASPSDLDLNGVSTIGNATFDNGIGSTLHTDLLANAYESSINPGASYGQGQPGAIWPQIKPPPIQSNPSFTGVSYADLDGLQPTGYVNPDTGQGY